MHRLIRVAAMATTASVVLASSLAAQTHTASASSNPGPVAQQRGGAPMSFTLLGGIATGEGGLDLGIALAGSFEWDVREWPVNLRLDPYVARHSGDCGGPGDIDCDLTILGAGVNVAYHFPVTANAPQWFILGGLGLYHSSFDIDSDVFPGFDAGGSSTDLGIQIGGGVRFGGGRYRVEARYMSVENFDTIPILFGIAF